MSESGARGSDLVQSLWIGDRLAPMQRLSIRSFLDQGHEYHLYAYEDIAGVPKGTRLCDAATILPRDSIFCYQDGFGKGSYSAFSNLFRYQLLLEKGGWWVDTDVVCIKRFDFATAFVFASERLEDQSLVTSSCVLKSPPGAEYLAYCVRVCESKDPAELKWSEIGPYLLSEAVERFALTQHRVPPYVFNPVNWTDFADILTPGFDLSRLAGSYGVHLWNQMWKHHSIDPSVRPAPGSLYEFLTGGRPGTSGFRA